MPSPKVFISYSQDSLEHRDRVYRLKVRLFKHGIVCISDHSFAHRSPPQGWRAWMEEQIREADYVLIVCTETYRRRAERREEPGKGLGVAWESALITNEIYRQAGRNERFIPLIFAPDDRAHIPDWLQQWNYYHVESDDGYEMLLRHLLDAPLYEEPELGELPVLPPRVRVTAPPAPKDKPAPPPAPVITPPPPRIVRPAAEPPRTFAEDLGKGVMLEMIRIEAGAFMMGSNENETEKPRHRVTISQPFYLGKYPVTQAQWQAVMGNNPSHFKGAANLPVERVTWEEAAEFCKALSNREREYRLPTEAEWEYACRAGTTTRFCFGDDDERLGEYAWYNDNSGNKTHPVGQKKPNAWGLYDLHGNVWEWCQDVWHDNYKGAPDDGSARLSGGDSSSRVLRGGSWFDTSIYCRSAYRLEYDPDARFDNIGFRVVVGARTS